MTVIPDQKYELKKLKELVISKNKLPDIPCAFMRDMESLNLLNASDNEIGEHSYIIQLLLSLIIQ